jgi:hypothetical protein
VIVWSKWLPWQRTYNAYYRRYLTSSPDRDVVHVVAFLHSLSLASFPNLFLSPPQCLTPELTSPYLLPVSLITSSYAERLVRSIASPSSRPTLPPGAGLMSLGVCRWGLGRGDQMCEGCDTSGLEQAKGLVYPSEAVLRRWAVGGGYTCNDIILSLLSCLPVPLTTTASPFKPTSQRTSGPNPLRTELLIRSSALTKLHCHRPRDYRAATKETGKALGKVEVYFGGGHSLEHLLAVILHLPSFPFSPQLLLPPPPPQLLPSN